MLYTPLSAPQQPVPAAMSYTDAELEAMMTDLESDLVERKESALDRRKIRRNICAFANDLPRNNKPGVLLVGVRDDGSCASLPVDDDLLGRLTSIHGEGQILPLPSLAVQKRVLRGCDVAVVMVTPSDEPPVRFQGRVWVRVGPSVREGSAADERKLAERRRASDLPFDCRPAAGASLAALDSDFVRHHYLPSAIDQDVLRRNTRSFDAQLHSLRLAHAGVPTWGALIAFAPDPLAFVPGASVQFLRLDGNDVTAPIVTQRHLAGRLDDVVRQLNELLALNIAVRTEVAGSVREQRQPEYPLDALRQLAHNAIMHRSYEGTHTPVRVYWYADRVEIVSPGGLYGRMTPETCGHGDTDYRNPLLAEVMANLGFAQRFGLGIPLARKALWDNGNPPPEFFFDQQLVKATVRAPTESSPREAAGRYA